MIATSMDSLLSEDVLVAQAIRVLMQELGPVEATRFLMLARHERGLDIGSDSVQRHREWQDTLDPEEFLRQVLGEATRDPPKA